MSVWLGIILCQLEQQKKRLEGGEQRKGHVLPLSIQKITVMINCFYCDVWGFILPSCNIVESWWIMTHKVIQSCVPGRTVMSHTTLFMLQWWSSFCLKSFTTSPFVTLQLIVFNYSAMKGFVLNLLSI